MTRLHVPAALLALVVAAPLSIASAQAASKDTALTKFVQYAIPTSPALAFIGAANEKINRPTAPKEIATLLANGIDASGKVVQGLALEVAPGQLLRPNMDRAEYTSFSGYLISNAAVSLGTVKSAGDSTSTNVGLGFRVTLFDRSDPHAGSADRVMRPAFEAALTKCSPPGSGPIAGDTAKIAAFRKCFVAADSVARTEFRRAHWNDWALTMSWATGIQLEGSAWNAGTSMGSSATAVLAAPLCLRSSTAPVCRHGLWLVQAGYESRDSVSGAPTAMARRVLGARGTIGSESFGVFGEFLALHRVSGGSASESRSASEWSAGIEFSVTEQLWASTGVGSRYLDAVGDSKSVVLLGLRLNTSKERKLGFVPR